MNLTDLYSNAVGYEGWPEPGEKCLYCSQGIIEQQAGSRVCDYCGKLRLSSQAETFQELEVGTRFYSATDSGRVVSIKVKPAEWWGENAVNALIVHNDRKQSFGPLTAVIREEKTEIIF